MLRLIAKVPNRKKELVEDNLPGMYHVFRLSHINFVASALM